MFNVLESGVKSKPICLCGKEHANTRGSTLWKHPRLKHPHESKTGLNVTKAQR